MGLLLTRRGEGIRWNRKEETGELGSRGKRKRRGCALFVFAVNETNEMGVAAFCLKRK